MKKFTAENIASLIVDLNKVAAAQEGKGNPLVGEICRESADALVFLLSALIKVKEGI